MEVDQTVAASGVINLSETCVPATGKSAADNLGSEMV